MSSTPSTAATAPRPAGISFVGAAMVVSSLTFLSRITGLVRDSIQARILGQAAVADSFAYGFQIPNLFRRLFGEGALTAAFIPVYTDLLKTDRTLARRFAWLCLFLMTGILLLLTVAGELILWRLHQAATSPDVELTLRLTMIMLPYMPLVCLVAMFGSILQVHDRFAPSAAQPILLNVVMVSTMLYVGWGVTGEDSLAGITPMIAASVIVAGLWQCFSQGWLLIRHEPMIFDFAGTRASLKIMLATWLPMLIALSVFQLNTFIDSNIAYFLSPKEGSAQALHILGWTINYPIEPGGLAALFRSQLLYQFPLGVFGIAIATAVFPALAHAASEPGEAGKREFASILRRGLRLTLFIGLPASVGLLIVRLPVCRVLFEGRLFTLEDSLRCAGIVAAYAPAIWAYSMTHVLTRAFYARKNSRTPMRLSVAMVFLNLALNLTLVWFLRTAGLAAATTICAILQCLILLRLVRRYVPHPVDGEVWKSWRRTFTLSILMGACLLPIALLFEYYTRSKTMAAVELAVLMMVGVGAFLGGAWLTGCEEIRWLLKSRNKKPDPATLDEGD